MAKREYKTLRGHTPPKGEADWGLVEVLTHCMRCGAETLTQVVGTFEGLRPNREPIYVPKPGAKVPRKLCPDCKARECGDEMHDFHHKWNGRPFTAE